MNQKKKNVDAWIARDKNGFLGIYFHAKPYKYRDMWVPVVLYRNDMIVLDVECYPAVTYENSPIKIDFKLP